MRFRSVFYRGVRFCGTLRRAFRFGGLLRSLRAKPAQAFVNFGVFAVKIVNFADFIVVQVVCGVGVKKRREVIQRLLRRSDIFKRAHDVVAQNAEKSRKARVFKLACARFCAVYLIKFKPQSLKTHLKSVEIIAIDADDDLPIVLCEVALRMRL